MTQARRRDNAAPRIPRKPLTPPARRGCSPLGAPPRRFIGSRSRA